MTPKLPAWMSDRSRRRKQNARSRRQETSVARSIGGRRQRGSGSSWRAPGDVVAEEYLVETKYTDKSGFALRLTDWFAIRNKAAKLGREPAMLVDFMKEGRVRLRLVIMEVPRDD